jgi:hypothetical protein
VTKTVFEVLGESRNGLECERRLKTWPATPVFRCALAVCSGRIAAARSFKIEVAFLQFKEAAGVGQPFAEIIVSSFQFSVSSKSNTVFFEN